MTDIKTLTFISDPGHAWLEVSLKDLQEYPEAAAAISHYSYINNGKAYLEEDCDAGHFLNALKDAGVKFAFLEVHQENTPIRGYAAYK